MEPSNVSPYAKIPQMRPYDPIPEPSESAKQFATLTYENYRNSSQEWVDEFEAKFEAWKNSWEDGLKARMSSAYARCEGVEYDDLLDMGPSIRPLVIYKLLEPDNFTAVYLYNHLEENKEYLVDSNDILNFLTLQRQNNLLIDINQDRKW